jgi:hypothetical protein
MIGSKRRSIGCCRRWTWTQPRSTVGRVTGPVRARASNPHPDRSPGWTGFGTTYGVTYEPVGEKSVGNVFAEGGHWLSRRRIQQ